jgi:hypothetical protein
LFRGFVDQHKGKRLGPETLKELAPLSKVLERDQEYGQIVKRERGAETSTQSTLVWRRARRWQTQDSPFRVFLSADQLCKVDVAHATGKVLYGTVESVMLAEIFVKAKLTSYTIGTLFGGLALAGRLPRLVQASPVEQPSSLGKCYGIAKAGKNDCEAGARSCAGQGK